LDNANADGNNYMTIQSSASWFISISSLWSEENEDWPSSRSRNRGHFCLRL